MLTFRFEGSEGDYQKNTVVQSHEYDTIHKPNVVDVIIPNKDGVKITYPVGNYDSAYDRCYVMNDNGSTIDKIDV